MSDRIIEDGKRHPRLFAWNGSIGSDVLRAWLAARGLNVPEDLLRFWMETGGGEAFESETILGPFGDLSLGEDLEGQNAFHKGRGMPDGYLVFHCGLTFTAIRLADAAYVKLVPPTYHETETYKSLEDWYLTAIRGALGLRYGLEPVGGSE